MHKLVKIAYTLSVSVDVVKTLVVGAESYKAVDRQTDSLAARGCWSYVTVFIPVCAWPHLQKLCNSPAKKGPSPFL